MKKITYLFGAGASIGAIPIVKNFIKGLVEFHQYIKSQKIWFRAEDTFANFDDINKKILVDEFIEDILWVITEGQNHQSMDTFAKKLYIRGDLKQLNILKTVISGYLNYVQFKENATKDMRYDSFFASILGAAYSELPDNMRILTWNYDYQFEIAFNEFMDGKSSLSNLKNQLGVRSKSFSLASFFRNDNFGIYKLNGTPTIDNESSRRETFSMDSYMKFSNKVILDKVLLDYTQCKYHSNNYSSNLSYAWENFYDENIIEVAKKATVNTEILVIIGYSFPFFNRNQDRELIRNMGVLERIYFQDPSAHDIITRFQAISDVDNIELIPYTDTYQFFLPPEI